MAMNIMPIAGIAYYLKSSIEQRQLELERMADLVQLAPNEIAARLESICKTCTSTILQAGKTIVPVLPHAPESSVLVFTSDDVVNNIDHSIPGTAVIFDAITASRQKSDDDVALNFVHFGVSATSELGKRLVNGKDRRATLIYTGGPISDVALSLVGDAVVIEDERVKRYYWRDRWNAFLKKPQYLLVKFVPSEVTVNCLQAHDGETLVDGIKITRATGTTQWKKL